MGRLGLTAFHSPNQFGGYDLRVFCIVTTFFLLWLVVALTAFTYLGHLRRRLTRNRYTWEKILDVFIVASAAMFLTFTAAVMNHLGPGNTYGVTVTFYIDAVLLALWFVFAISFKRRLYDWFLLLPLLIVNGMLWSRALHSANGPMDPPPPVRTPR